MKNWLVTKLKDTRGSSVVELVIGVAVKVSVLLVCLFCLCYMFNVIKVYVACDKVARSVSVTGAVDAQTYSLAQTLVGDNLTVSTDITGTFFDAAHTKIQLRDTFLVTMTSSYDIPVITPLSGGDPVMLSVPISARVRGMSEKFWRE